MDSCSWLPSGKFRRNDKDANIDSSLRSEWQWSDYNKQYYLTANRQKIMYPYLEVLGIGFNMTGLGIIVALGVFLASVGYLCRKYHQSFLQFFYFLPIIIILTYFCWSYVDFLMSGHFIPLNREETLLLLSPKNYGFHFVGILIGLALSFVWFFKSLERTENKKIWVDILFVSFAVSLIPLGVFLLMGDSFLGKPYEWILAVKALHPDSILNKFQGVYPIGVFVSLAGLVALIFFALLKRNGKKFGFGLLGFVVLLILFGGILQFQQYPRYIPISYEMLIFDIKHYISFFVIMLCFYAYHKRN